MRSLWYGTGKIPMAWSKWLQGMHGSCVCWDGVWSRSKVSGLHRAAKTGVLLVVSCAMMGQLCRVDWMVDGVVAMEVGEGRVLQGLGAWGGCLGGIGVEGECVVVIGFIIIGIVVGSVIGGGGTIRLASGSRNWQVSMFRGGRCLRASGIQRVSLVSMLLFIICSIVEK